MDAHAQERSAAGETRGDGATAEEATTHLGWQEQEQEQEQEAWATPASEQHPSEEEDRAEVAIDVAVVASDDRHAEEDRVVDDVGNHEVAGGGGGSAEDEIEGQQRHPRSSQEGGGEDGGQANADNNDSAAIEAAALTTTTTATDNDAGDPPASSPPPLLPASTSSTNGPTCCRVCLEEINLDAFINGTAASLDCLCRGPLSVVHVECAQKWFNDVRHTNVCEICQHPVTNVTGVPGPPTNRPPSFRTYRSMVRDEMNAVSASVSPLAAANNPSLMEDEGRPRRGAAAVRSARNGILSVWRSGWYIVRPPPNMHASFCAREPFLTALPTNTRACPQAFAVVFLILIIRLGVL